MTILFETIKTREIVHVRVHVGRDRIALAHVGNLMLSNDLHKKLERVCRTSFTPGLQLAMMPQPDHFSREPLKYVP